MDTPEIATVPLDNIPTDEAAQTRVKHRASVVREYAAAMKTQLAEENWRFPPVVLFAEGTEYHLGDGCHRVLAARLAGLTEIAAEVRPGTRRDAILFGISANNTHGLPRTNADKRKAVAILLGDPEWSQWSDREIGRRCLVGNNFVSRMRRSASVLGAQIAHKVERNGTVYEMKSKDGASAKQVDGLGIPLPEEKIPVFAASADFAEAKDLIERVAACIDRIAQGPAGDFYRGELVRSNGGFACPALRQCQKKLLAAQPYCAYCPLCHPLQPARPRTSCKTCGGRGWTTRHAFEACSSQDREVILKLRQPD